MQSYLNQLIEKYSSDYLEIHYEEKFYNYVSYSGKELENVGSAQSSCGNVRIYKDGKWAFVSFNDKDIEKYIIQAIDNLQYESKLIKSSGAKGIKSSDAVKHSYKTDYKINPAEIPLKDKVSLMNNYNNIILGHDKIQTSRSTYKDHLQKNYFANSEDSYIESEKVFTGIALFAMARDGMNVQRGYYTDAGFHGYEIAENREEECENICKAAIDLLSAEPLPKGKYNVLLDPRMTGVFAHEAFGHLSESDFIYENEGMKSMMTLGREFGSSELNIIDDATLKGYAGYLPYDDEGIEGKRKYLIKNGKLNSRLNSRETAFLLGEELSGNARALNPKHAPIVRMTNTFIDNGKYSQDELLNMVEDGIYCIDYLGGMTNLEMFTFTAGRAYEVKNGKIKRLLRDVVLSGNVFETLNNIKAIGNDLQHFGGLGGCGKAGQNGLPVTVGGPHTYVENVVIGGK